jgi:hypothetical protein
MRQAISAVLVGISLSLSTPSSSPGAPADVAAAVAQARRLLEANDHASAAALLEDALVDARPIEKPAIIELLRKSYEVLAKQAEAAGQSRKAAHYRDNLAILDRARDLKPGPVPAQEKRKSQTPPAQPAPEKGSSIPKGKVAQKSRSAEQPAPAPALDLSKTQPPQPASLPEPAPLADLSEPSLALKPAERAPAPSKADAAPASPADSSPSKSDLDQADRLFAEKRYNEAGLRYSILARQNRLPESRKEHWAYCRWVEVVRQINAGPRSALKWDEIEAEIQSIQRLTPNSWYGEYLRNKVAEVRRRGRRSMAQSKNVVVRGSAPDEPEPKRFSRQFGRERSGSTARPNTSAAAAASAPVAEQPLKLPGDEHAAGSGEDWQVRETANFRIFHHNAHLAGEAAETAEQVRAAQIKKWQSPLAGRPWSPRCELYLYPDGKLFAQATHQPESSPGFSTMISDGNRVITRRMSLRADHPGLLRSIVPHEVTHVVLADLFTNQQIPRWADEGLAVLAEPRAEQQRRWAELQEPLQSRRLFTLSKLMAIDYPDEKDWSLYYAQSVSLAHYLVAQGTPARFIQFVRDSLQSGSEAALREHYQIDGFAQLQDRWLDHARKEVATLTASSRDSQERK